MLKEKTKEENKMKQTATDFYQEIADYCKIDRSLAKSLAFPLTYSFLPYTPDQIKDYVRGMVDMMGLVPRNSKNEKE